MDRLIAITCALPLVVALAWISRPIDTLALVLFVLLCLIDESISYRRSRAEKETDNDVESEW